MKSKQAVEKITNPYLRLALESEPKKPDYRVVDRQAVYEADWVARPYASPVTPENQNVLSAVRHYALVDQPPLVFNWVARRDPVWLVSGDLPRFALATIDPSDEDPADPQHLCLGDVRLSMTVGGERFWLHECGRVRTRYMPWGTRHEVSLDTPAALNVVITTTQVENRGIAVRTAVRSLAGEPVAVTFEYVVGAMRFDHSSAVLTRYLRTRPDECPWHLPQRIKAADRIDCNGSVALITNPDAPYRAWVAGDGPAERGDYPFGDETREFVVYRHEINATSEFQQRRLLVGKYENDGPAPVRMEFFDVYEADSRQYYTEMLGAMRMETPDEILDAGFHSAVVNLDYGFHDFAWLEGVHQWCAYWANNYQIRAALLLGQTARTREALIALATRGGGPGNARKADGSPFGGEKDQDALPYYIVSLWRYWQATEDRDTLKRIWPAVTQALHNWLRFFDPDQDGLLHWHKGVNMFMYQGDHHRLPGVGFSPSIMAAFNLDCMAEMAEALGGEAAEPAPAWRRRAVYMRSEVQRRLWLPEEGRFAGCADLQGHLHKAAYYTDFAFPILFADYPDHIKWLSLQAMDRMLSLGDELLRTGTLKPDFFGNNAPHITSNCEGAEAYFAMGRAERGTALLRGAARASTILTNSPGAFPEYMGLRGEGLPDYIFGPPTGSYLIGVLRGLWGVDRRSPKHAFEWAPTLPAGWDHASLHLPGIDASMEGAASDRAYRLCLAPEQAATLRLPLFGRRVQRVAGSDGEPLEHRILPHPGGGFVVVELPAAGKHFVRLVTADAPAVSPLPKTVRPGETIEATLHDKGVRLIDPQRVFTSFEIRGTTFRGTVGDTIGPKTIFLEDPAANTMRPLAIDVQAATADAAAGHRHEPPLEMEGDRTAVDLAPFFNDNVIPVVCWQPYGDPRFVEGPVRHDHVPVEIGPYHFHVRDEEPRLVRLEVGGLRNTDNVLVLAPESRESLRLPVRRAICGIEFLLIADTDSRLTDMAVAECVFTYSDGFEERRPLVYGRELDHPTYPFATGTVVKELPGRPGYGLTWFAEAFALPARQEREVDSIELRVTAMTTTLGVFAVNLVEAS